MAQELKTRNDVCEFLLEYIRLNRYDNKFISNITQKYVRKDKPLTLKQSEVFDIIVLKYSRQFKKLGIDALEISSKQWKIPLISISELNAQSFFKIEDDIMKINFSFNKKVIEEIRTLIYDDECIYLNNAVSDGLSTRFGENEKYDFVWDKENMYWHGKFNVNLFRSLYDFAKKHSIKLDKSVIDVTNNTYGPSSNWASQLYLVHNRLYINNITETMIKHLADFDLTNVSEDNIENICNYFGLEPLSEYNENKTKLMLSKPILNSMYNTETSQSQDDLYNYLKTRNNILFYLPPLNQSALWNLSKPMKNLFIVERKMEEWDLPIRIEIYNTMSVDKLDLESISEIDTIITTLDIEELISSNTKLGEIALNNKFIRIK